MKQLIAIILMGIGLGYLWASANVVSLSDNELVVEYRPASWELRSEGNFTRIETNDMNYPIRSGAPLIPFDEVKIGIPPSGDISYSVLDSKIDRVSLENPLVPVPTIYFKDGVSAQDNIPDPEAYRQPMEQMLKQLPVQNYRGYSFIPLEIFPFRYDGLASLEVVTYLKLRISVQGNTRFRSSESPDQASELILGKMLNAQQARTWNSVQRYTVNYAPFSQGAWWVRIETNKEGMYRINPSQLNFLNLSDLDPTQFRLFSTSGKVINVDSMTGQQAGPEFREVPIIVSGEADHSFDAQDYILFYGSSRDSYEYNADVQTSSTTYEPIYYNPYSQNQVFWLTSGAGFSGDPQRISITPPVTTYTSTYAATSVTKHQETELQRREDNGFLWYGAAYFGNSTAEYQLQTDLDDVEASRPQKLAFQIIQENISGSTYHQISVSINGGQPLVNPANGSTIFSWSGSSTYNFSLAVSGFVSGLNTISLRVIRNGTDNLYFNWFDITHYQNHSITNGRKTIFHPSFLGSSGPFRFDLQNLPSALQVYKINSIYDVEQLPMQGSYFVSSGSSSTRYLLIDPAQALSPAIVEEVTPNDLTENSSQTDNIIITPQDFMSQAQTLAGKYLATYGIHSRVILLDDVFNQFNGGHPDPAAIRTAMRYFYQNLPAPRLSSLTLLGLGTIDWRNFSGSAATKNKMIVYQNSTDATDDFYGMLNTNQYPEIAIGRYPVKNESEMNIMLQNFTNYTENPTPGWWRNSMVFLGDDLNNGDTTYEYYHTQQAQEAASVVNPSLQVQKIFALEYEYDEFQNKPKARDDMFAAINEGRLMWYYVGHGGYDKLGAEDYMNGATDMGRFNNTGKLPFFMAASCSVSHFDYWGYESLGQKVVLMDNIGAIASLAATRISFPANNHGLAKLLLNSLANNRNPLGFAIIDAKIHYTESNINDAVYVLLGDPVIRVVPPERDSTLQVVPTIGGSILHARDTATVSGHFSGSQLSGDTEIKVFDTQTQYSLGPGTTVTHQGNRLFYGTSSVQNSAFDAGFVVPDDVTTGTNGLVVAYIWDATAKKDYVSYHTPLVLSNQTSEVENTDSPEINIYLGSRDFRPGDTVSTTTTLYADIQDANGINISGAAGHNIMLVLDNSLQPVNITPYFQYDRDSHTKGSLTYPLSGLSEGAHSAQVIAFDNFNLPSVTSTQFVAKSASQLSIDRLLPYPNPMSRDGNITFMLSMDADVTIRLYTMNGRKIRTLKSPGRNGFNSVYFDGRDEQGDRLANNTYFIKVEAKALDGSKSEATEKLVIYK